MDLMLDHLRNGRALPPSQVVHTTPRGAGAPPITATNVPPIADAPPASALITYQRRAGAGSELRAFLALWLFAGEAVRLGRVAALIVRIGRIAAHRAGGNHRERRLGLLLDLHQLARCPALLDPRGQHLQQVDARGCTDAHVVCARRDVEAQEILDV